MANEPKQQLSDQEIEKVALKKSFDDFYAKTGKNPMTNQQEALAHHQQITGDVQKGIPNPEAQQATAAHTPPQQNFNPEDFAQQQMKETDPDLIVDSDIVKLPSEGYFYPIKEVTVEYLTAKDEDVLTTPALLENGTVLDEILKRKVKTKSLDIENMLSGDKNAILIFLRASSYGAQYDVQITNPKTGKPFKATVDLTKIQYKKVTDHPDDKKEFMVQLPMRKKMVKFRLLGDRELRNIIDRAEMMKESYQQIFAETSSLKLKAAITEIDGNRNPDYINRFVDAMPAGDALKIRKKMEDVTPGVDLTYDFVTPDGTPFRAPLAMGIDFFFPSL